MNRNNDYVDILPWKKSYSNPNGNKIMMKHHDVDVNFENPIFRNFSDRDKCHFFYYYMNILDIYFFDSYCDKDFIENDIYFFETYIKKYLEEENFISIKLITNITFNGLPYEKKIFKRKERPDICYSCSKRKTNPKNTECIYIGFS